MLHVDLPGQPVELKVRAYPDTRFTGTVKAVAPAVNPAHCQSSGVGSISAIAVFAGAILSSTNVFHS